MQEAIEGWKRAGIATAAIAVSSCLAVAVWAQVAGRPSEEARGAAVSSGGVSVNRDAGVWHFTRQGAAPDSLRSLIIFPAGRVDPRSYAPLAHAAARRGHRAYIIESPRRTLFGGVKAEGLNLRIARVLQANARAGGWLLVGYGGGGASASTLAAFAPAGMAGVVLIGSEHPRDIDLSSVPVPVALIAGTRDGLTRTDDIAKAQARLPSHARLIWIEGGNHSQFAWHGYRPGDRTASIAGADQRTQTTNAVLAMLLTSTSLPAFAATEVATPAGLTSATQQELAELRSRIVIPVRGIVRTDLRDTFAEPRGQRLHEAIDILAPRGTPVLAATDGRVLKLFDSKAGGLMVYATDMSERFILLYGHLDDYADGISDGMQLERGQVIGYVGTTGNAPPGTPHLHFGILRGQPAASWSRGIAVNPYPLLF